MKYSVAEPERRKTATWKSQSRATEQHQGRQGWREEGVGIEGALLVWGSDDESSKTKLDPRGRVAQRRHRVVGNSCMKYKLI